MKAISTQSRHTSTQHNNHSRQSTGPLPIRAQAFAGAAACFLTGAEEIKRWRLEVVSPGRTLFGTRAHCAVSSATLRRGVGAQRSKICFNRNEQMNSVQ